MLATVTVKVGEGNYVISKLPATKAIRVHLALGKAILEALASGDSAVGSLGALAGQASLEAAESADMEKVVAMILRLFTALPADDWTSPDGRRYMGFESLSRLLLDHVKLEGRVAVDPDAHFDGKVQELYLVLWEVLKHNFADFLGDVLSRSRKSEAKPA